MLEEFLEILKYVLPSLVVFLTAYLVLRSYLKNDHDKELLRLRMDSRNDMLNLRLHAYERLTLFLERINPTSILLRMNIHQLTAKQLQKELLMSIRVEFEHNLSQQIYVSAETWGAVKVVKDEIIKSVNLVTASLPPEASGMDLSKRLLEFFRRSEDVIPTERALEIIKAEVRKIY